MIKREEKLSIFGEVHTRDMSLFKEVLTLRLNTLLEITSDSTQEKGILLRFI